MMASLTYQFFSVGQVSKLVLNPHQQKHVSWSHCNERNIHIFSKNRWMFVLRPIHHLNQPEKHRSQRDDHIKSDWLTGGLGWGWVLPWGGKPGQGGMGGGGNKAKPLCGDLCYKASADPGSRRGRIIQCKTLDPHTKPNQTSLQMQ